MFRRLFRAVVSFAIVWVAYFSYAMVVVPLVERTPDAPASIAGSNNGTGEFAGPSDGPSEPLLARIRPFLPENGWEFDPQTMMMGSDQFTLLIHDYDTTDQDTLVIKPCTVVFFPDGPATPENPQPSVIVLRAPQGAEMSFEDGVDLSRLKMGRMQHCLLRGDVSIDGILASSDDNGSGDANSDGNNTPRPPQRLHLATSNVQMTDNRIWTSSLVRFALGENHGSGRKLSVEMTEVEEIDGTRTEKKRNVQSITVHEQVKLQLAVAAGENPFDTSGEAAPLGGPGSGGNTTDVASSGGTEEVTITSSGPFRFDALTLVATFEDQVDVIRNGVGGSASSGSPASSTSSPVDQLACERLSIFFGGSGSDKMKPQRIKAEGHPVVGSRAGENAQLRCEKLVYHLGSGEIELKSTSQVLLRRGEDVVEATEVRVQPGPDGAIGEILASGKGRLQATLPGRSDGQVSAQWTRELRLRPDNGQPLLSVLGDATVRFAETGTLSSQEIWMWLNENKNNATSSSAGSPTPPAGEKSKTPSYTPDRMLAQGQVTINSTQLVGHTERLEMWFTPMASLGPSPNSNRSGGPTTQPVGLARSTPRPAPTNNLLGNSQANGPRSRYQVKGDLVSVQVGTDGQTSALRDVTITGNVQMREHAAAGAAEKKAMSVRGASLQLLNAHIDDTRLIITGDDKGNAVVEAGGMVLSGAKIEGFKARNTVEVNGPGQMQLPMNQDLSGAPTTSTTPLTIAWKSGMRFDGQRVNFVGDVTAATPQQLVRTPRLVATLTRDIDFTNPGRVDDLGLHNIHCPEEVTLESRTIENGQVQSIDRLQLRDLRIDQATGDIRAAGPGSIKTHRFGNQMALGPAAPGGNPAAQPNEKAPDQLTFLRVDFQESVVGNFRRKRLTFLNQVKCVYGPVRDWQQELDPQGFDHPGPKDVLLSCDRLAIQEMPGALRDKQNFDLDATGNMRVDGEQFSAEGQRLSYNTGKSMLTLEGTDQRDAQLWRASPSGGARANVAARKIFYWQDTNRVKVDGARFLNLDAPPAR